MTTQSVDEIAGLAGRCERYSPSGHHDIDRENQRDLNEKIGVAVGLKHICKVGDPALGNERWVPINQKPYTTSLDAAMTLVPDGHDVQIYLYFGRDGEGSAIVSPLKELGQTRIFAATPALALAAAALRARVHLLQQERSA